MLNNEVHMFTGSKVRQKSTAGHGYRPHTHTRSLNVIKTNKRIMDYRKKKTEHAPILIHGAAMEQVESFKFLGVHITNLYTNLYTRLCQRKALKRLQPP